MPADDLTDVDLVPGRGGGPRPASEAHGCGARLRARGVAPDHRRSSHGPSIQNPNMIHSTGVPEWQILIWIVAIAAVDLMPVPTTMSSVAFSLSFPIELSVALLFPVPLAALIALIGTSDKREFRGELPFLKGLFIRAQIAGAVICESVVIKLVVPSVGRDRQPRLRELGERGVPHEHPACCARRVLRLDRRVHASTCCSSPGTTTSRSTRARCGSSARCTRACSASS